MKICVAMSGGVDSSLVAYILKQQGHDVFGLTMKHLEGDVKENRPCCSLEDILDAKKICMKLGIKHYTLNLQEIFKEKVMDYFIQEYEQGRTPNPCVMCNKEVKIGTILKYVKELGGEYLATGHYAYFEDGKLYPGLDDNKDQSYFLSQVRKDDLKHVIFPLGKMSKDEVRQAAEEAGLINSKKADSQGVCFINKDYKEFLKSKYSNLDGNIVDLKGNILGKHNGIYSYTVGQRKGLRIAGLEAYYVLRIDPIRKEVVIGNENDLFSDRLECRNLNLFFDFNNVKYCYIKTRARDIRSKAEIFNVSEDCLELKFSEGVKAVTPGQIVAFYSEDGYLMGSGIIS